MGGASRVYPVCLPVGARVYISSQQALREKYCSLRTLARSERTEPKVDGPTTRVTFSPRVAGDRGREPRCFPTTLPVQNTPPFRFETDTICLYTTTRLRRRYCRGGSISLMLVVFCKLTYLTSF